MSEVGDSTPAAGEPDKGGRPTKLTPEFLEVAAGIINADDGDAALIFTDEELLFLINEKLPEDARVAHSTFKAWKSGETQPENYGRFLALIQKALLVQKQNLFARIRSKDDPQWTRWAWIIERKFDEWNIKRKLGIGTLPKDPAQTLVAAVLGDAPEEEA